MVPVAAALQQQVMSLQAELNAHGGKIAVDRGNGSFMIHDFNKYAA